MRLLAGILAIACLSGSLCRQPVPVPEFEYEQISQASDFATSPALAVGPDGTAYLTWAQEDTWTDELGRPWTSEDVLFAARTPAGSWSTPSRMTDGQHSARRPTVAAGSDGTVHLAWQHWVHDTRTEYWAVLYTSQAPGGSWTLPDTLVMQYQSGNPTLAVDRDAGRVHLYWQEFHSPYTGFSCYACKPAGGDWQDFRYVPYDTATVPFECEMRTDEQGAVHIVQQQSQKIYHLERGPDGLWEEPVRLSENATRMGTRWPTFALGDGGSLQVVWTDDDTCYRGFAYRERTAGGDWAPIQGPYRETWRYDDWGTASATHLRCVHDGEGKLHLVWHGARKLGYAAHSDGTWSQPCVLADGLHPALNAMAMMPDGSILYAWEDGDVFCGRFRP